MDFSYRPDPGVCSRKIDITVNDDNIIENVKFTGGCPGNLQGISRLVKGMTADQVITALSGVTCGAKSTSCPDQLAKALQAFLAEKSKNA